MRRFPDSTKLQQYAFAALRNLMVSADNAALIRSKTLMERACKEKNCLRILCVFLQSVTSFAVKKDTPTEKRESFIHSFIAITVLLLVVVLLLWWWWWWWLGSL